MSFKKENSRIWIYIFISLAIITSFVVIKDLFLNVPSVCSEFSKDYRGTCLQLNAQKLAVNDFDSAWKMCKQINQDSLRDECYNDIVVAIGKEKPEDVQQYCRKINSEKWRGECLFNMALFLTKTNFTKAFAMCDKTEIYVPFCYHDVAGEISLINTTAALNICEKQTDDLLRRTCFHGIGKYLGKSKPDEVLIYCDLVKDIDVKKSCYHGAGWGISEIGDSSKAISYCKKIKSNLTDNCLVGVAWKVSKNDEEEAREVCNTLKGELIKEVCLNFPK